MAAGENGREGMKKAVRTRTEDGFFVQSCGRGSGRENKAGQSQSTMACASRRPIS